MKPYEYISHIVQQIAGDVLPRDFDYLEFKDDVRWDTKATCWKNGNLQSNVVYDLNNEDPDQKLNKYIFYNTVNKKWTHTSTKFSRLHDDLPKGPMEIRDHSFEPVNYDMDKTLWTPPKEYTDRDFKSFGYFVLHSEISSDIDIL